MLINCPECNQTVSDKAEVCPHCGIRLNPAHATLDNSVAENNKSDNNTSKNPNSNGGHKGLIISFVIALIITGIGYFYYSNAQKQKEIEAYEYAMSSGDELVLQNYLSKFMDAPREHRDSVNARLHMLNEEADEWNNAINTGTRGALLKYIEENPSSPHLAEAKNKVDSLDYAKAERDYKNASNANSGIEALEKYIAEHPDGRYTIKVQEIMDEIKAKELSPEELAMARDVCKKFFQAINSKNENKLLLTITETLNSFLNRSNASSQDVVEFMNRLYKSDITNMNWHILDNFKAEKVAKANGNGGYTIKVQFGAEQHIERKDPTKETLGKYMISAEITPEGKINNFNMKKFNHSE